jgi:hypothetical protein
MENPCMMNSRKKHQFICCLNSGPFKMMPQSTLFWFFFGEVVGWGRRKLLSIERQEETHTCLKLIPPTHNHETHQRKKKKKKKQATRQHSLKSISWTLNLARSAFQSILHKLCMFACETRLKDHPPLLTHTHTCTHTHTFPKPKRNNYMSKEPKKRIIFREFWHIIHNP